MDGFADLLTDAFAESSVPSFSDGDLDFESLGFEEKGEEDKAEDSTTKTDEALLQEVTDESEALLGKATTDTLLSAEEEESTGDENDEEEFERKESEESYTSSEEERSSSGEDVENVGASGDLLMSVCCSDDPYDSQIEDGIFAEGQRMPSDSPKDSNKVQCEDESDEEASCIRGIPECGHETVMMKEAEESNGEELSDSDHEDVTAEQEENIPTKETENPYKISPMEEDDLEFPCLSLQNLQDLVTEVDGEEQVLKMTDFTGDEHQEAGETIADYPSDFSSGEFTRAELNASPLLPEQEPSAVTETWISGMEDSGHEKDDGFLYSTDMEMNADKITSLDGAAGEERVHESAAMSENNSYSSDDDEELLRRTKNQLMSVRDVDNNTELEDVQLREFSRWSSSDDTIKNRDDPADFIRSCFDTVSTNTHLSERLLTTEDTDETEDSSSDENQHPAEDEYCHSVAQKVTTSSSNQGSIDDSFFFHTDSSKVTEQLVDDEEEEKRNAEQMQERIEAFKKFYDNSDDENRREERQVKVQFCEDLLSQVNYYDTDSSDRDSPSSSSDTEEDLSSDELREPEDLLREHEDRVEPEDLQREHKDRVEPEDLQREHKDRVEPEDLQREHKDRVKPEDLQREHKDRVKPEDLLREHEDRVEPEDLQREHKDRVKPEDLQREHEDRVEPEDLLREPKDRVEPEDLLREHEDRVEPEDLLREHEDLLREHEDRVEPEDLLREHEDIAEPEDPLREFEDTPMCDPPNSEQPQRVSEVRDIQTCTKTRKGVSKLKLMFNLGVMTMMGLAMFWLITDQPDWLKHIFSV